MANEPEQRKRLDDWDIRLFSWMNTVRNEDLEWGKFDCVVGLAAGAVEQQTGVNLAVKAPEYRTEKQALKLIAKAGGYEKLMDRYLNRTRSRHRGNIVLLKTSTGPVFGVRVGSKAAHMTEAGLMYSQIPNNTAEWTVES